MLQSTTVQMGNAFDWKNYSWGVFARYRWKIKYGRSEKIFVGRICSVQTVKKRADDIRPYGSNGKCI